MPLLVFLASFINKKSTWKISQFDVICGIFSIAGLILWLITRVGNIAIMLSIVADGLAALPTIVKSYKYPETESGWTYLTGSIGALLVLLTIHKWTFAQYGFPLYIFIVTFIIFILAHFKIGKSKKSPLE